MYRAIILIAILVKEVWRMKKDRYGICYSFYAVIGFVLALFGQPLLCGLLLGFAIVTSKNEWVIKQVIQAFVLSLAAFVLQLLQTGVNVVADVPLFGIIFSGMYSLVAAVINLCVLLICIFGIVSAVRGNDSGIPGLKSFAEWALGHSYDGESTAEVVKKYATQLASEAKDLIGQSVPGSDEPTPIETPIEPATIEAIAAPAEVPAAAESVATAVPAGAPAKPAPKTAAKKPAAKKPAAKKPATKTAAKAAPKKPSTKAAEAPAEKAE